MMFKRLFGHCWSVINVTERYVEQSVVGGVSNSTVVSAFDTVARKKVVLKKAKNSIEKRNNIDEYALLKSLNHPNIIAPMDLVTEGLGFMVLPSYNGDMYDRIMKKKPSQEETRTFVRKLSSAVYYIHSLNIAHRDIKPDNILVNNDYSTVVLSDFGFSTNISTKPTDLCGTMSYLSPEAYRAVQNRDFSGNLDWKKCDVFSLGVTFYTICEFMKLVIREDRKPENLEQHDIDQRIDSMTCDRSLKDLLKKMLAVDPSQRISMDEVNKHPYLQ